MKGPGRRLAWVNRQLRLYTAAHDPYLARSGGPEVLTKRC